MEGAVEGTGRAAWGVGSLVWGSVSCSVADEAAEELGATRGAAGPRLFVVGGVHHPEAGVRPDPAQRLWLPPRRPMVHPRQPRQVCGAAEEQVRQRLAGQV